MRRVLKAEMLWVTGALPNDFFKESWTTLSKQELADKACRKGRNVYVMVVCTLLERVRGDLRLLDGDGANALI